MRYFLWLIVLLALFPISELACNKSNPPSSPAVGTIVHSKDAPMPTSTPFWHNYTLSSGGTDCNSHFISPFSGPGTFVLDLPFTIPADATGEVQINGCNTAGGQSTCYVQVNGGPGIGLNPAGCGGGPQCSAGFTDNFPLDLPTATGYGPVTVFHGANTFSVHMEYSQPTTFTAIFSYLINYSYFGSTDAPPSTPTHTATVPPTATVTPTGTLTPDTPTSTPTISPTVTASPTNTSTATFTNTPTFTSTPTGVPTIAPTANPTECERCRESASEKTNEVIKKALIGKLTSKLGCVAVCIGAADNEACVETCERALEAKEEIEMAKESKDIGDELWDCLEASHCFDAAFN